jgi:hypothetical protein
VSYIFLIVLIAAIVGIFRPYIRNTKRWHFALAAFASFVMIGITAPQPDATESTNSDNGDQSISADKTANAELSLPKSKWSYNTEKDEMRGGESRFASLDAENTINLDFPYGEQRGQILIRDSAKFGFDILVGVPSGQVLCNSFQNTYLSVKFDNGGIERFGCTDASDGTNNMVFLNSEKRFLEKLKKSKKLIVEAEFFQNGVQQMTFDTANLDWE